MKRWLSVVMVVVLLMASVVPTAVAAPTRLSGDVDGDGRVHLLDAAALQRHLNGWNMIIDTTAADVTGDGKMNLQDLGHLLRYLNGWDVELAPCAPVLTEQERAFYQSIVDSENAWLASTQLSNGALPMTPTNNGKVQMNPYFADFAALSLLNQPELYGDVVKKYMDWHFDHLNTAAEDPSGLDGTIFDYVYTVKNGVVILEEWSTPAPTYDSTDSYAATFVMVVEKYARQTGDTAYVLSHAQDIQRVLNSLFATMDNGLTYGQPKSKVKMLMDNCEVYAGLQAAVALYRDVLIPAGESTTETHDFLQNAVDDLVTAMEKDLWIGKYYAPAIYLDGSLYQPFSWARYYPSAVAQLFPILHGVLNPTTSRAQQLYAQFCSYYDWEHHRHPDRFVWSSNAYTASLMGDYDRVHSFLTAYSDMVTASRGDPLYNADAAWACMTAYTMTQLT